MAKQKPLLFGDTEAAVEAQAQYAFEREETPDYIPGYTEQIQANAVNDARGSSGMATTARKEHYFKQFGVAPKELPVKLTWVRALGLDGAVNSNVRVQQSEYRKRGYRPATEEDLKTHGYGLPPTAEVAADGSIRRNDVALWVVDGEQAKAYDRFVARKNAEFHSMENALQTSVDRHGMSETELRVISNERETVTDLSSLR